MPLQGTFDVLGFADVIGLLADKTATGRLHVRSRSIGANIYLDQGRLVGADVGEHVNSSTVDVRSRLEEVCFELLEAERGSFEFIPDTTGMGPPTIDLAVAEVLASARRQLEEWRDIQTVIPSLDLHPSVVADLANDEVTLSRERWRLVTAIDGRRSIRAIARLLGSSDYEVCRTVKALIQDGVVEIDAPVRPIPGSEREPRVFVDDGPGEDGEAGEDVGAAEELGAAEDERTVAGNGTALDIAALDSPALDIAVLDSPVEDNGGGEVTGPDGGGDPDYVELSPGVDRYDDRPAPVEANAEPERQAPEPGKPAHLRSSRPVPPPAAPAPTPSKVRRQGIIRIGRKARPSPGDS